MTTASGTRLPLEVTDNPIAREAFSFSLWLLGALFALLGAAVLVRRPDLGVARLFGLFAAFGALALVVGPSAGGPAPPWALMVLMFGMLGLSCSFVVFALAMTSEPQSSLRATVSLGLVGVGLLVLTGYGCSVAFWPDLYQVVRPVAFLYISACAFGSVALLALRSTLAHSLLPRQQARVSLWGTALGTLPFVGLTLVPEAMGSGSLLPVHWTVLPLGMLPIAFAYAILHYQFLGIRRLIHRGMVYGTATISLFVLVTLGLASLPLSSWSNAALSPAAIAAGLVGAVLLFFLLREVSRYTVDRLLYGGVIDDTTALEVLREHLVRFDGDNAGPGETLAYLVELLHLESALLFLGRGATETRLAAAAGPRSKEVSEQWSARSDALAKDTDLQDVAPINWGADSLLFARLMAQRGPLGYLLLGPKTQGEVFIDQERRFVSAVAPLLALAVEKTTLAEELRGLNQRLFQAAETERGRIAQDLHDGPLQKAMFIAAGVNSDDLRGRSLAHELVTDLREIGSRLRPSMLDDLGLVPSLEWLLESACNRSSFHASFDLHDVQEADRFPPDVEMTLFRVAQEAVNNALKHSQGAAITLRLAGYPDGLELSIADDGVGIRARANQEGGFGIPGMRERLLQVGGTLQMLSEPGQGTRVVATVPLVLPHASGDKPAVAHHSPRKP